VYSDGEAGISPIETNDEDGSRYNEEKGESRDNAVGANKRMILWKIAETIAHPFVKLA
jgi:hypothetical protein